MTPTAPTALPFSQACENNRAPILELLERAFAQSTHVLEIGSGTGQHSVYFAPHLPHLIWQTSDVTANHTGIHAWHAAHPVANLRAPVTLDLRDDDWPQGTFDAVFTANTLHIVAWPLVERMFEMVGEQLPAQGRFAIYGPFNYNGQFTSDSNRAFNAWLRERDADSGIRDIEQIMQLGEQHGLRLLDDNAMPANNRLLVFGKQE